MGRAEDERHMALEYDPAWDTVAWDEETRCLRYVALYGDSLPTWFTILVWLAPFPSGLSAIGSSAIQDTRSPPRLSPKRWKTKPEEPSMRATVGLSK